MQLNSLTALSPVDGRYRRHTEVLAPYFSEMGLMRYRVRVEVDYFIVLCQLPLPQLTHLDPSHFPALRQIYGAFGEADALRIKALEATTNHDVKAIEYFLKERLTELGLAHYQEFIHFGLTSQDINNVAIPLSLREATAAVIVPALTSTRDELATLADRWRGEPMLARTHGQAASPTTLGKELSVFVARLDQQLAMLAAVPFAAKFGGATGNFNAHVVAYPTTNWPAFADAFVHGLGLQRSHPTTQIEHYDHLAAYCHALMRLHTILLDLCRDAWQYVSLGYFRQTIKAGEVGSSAMPHKVNPIDFENAEGNLGVANALLAHLADKLPVSRLQRDLTDSTVLRNLGVPLAHSLVALASLRRGLSKLELNPAALRADLAANWAVVAEGIQTILRREGYPQPYEALKALTRTGDAITADTIAAFIESLAVAEPTKAELRAITPFNYLGTAAS